MAVSFQLGLIYLISELLLTVTRRSHSKTGTKQDRSTLGIIWLVIAISITAGVFVAENFQAAALPHGQIFASAGVALFHGPKGNSWKTFYEFPLPPGEVACGGRGKDGGPPEADPHTAFFIEGAKIDNGSQFDETMFPNANPATMVTAKHPSVGTEIQPQSPLLLTPRISGIRVRATRTVPR